MQTMHSTPLTAPSATADPPIVPVSLTFSKRRLISAKALSGLHLALLMNVESRLGLLHDFGLDKLVAITHPDRFETVARMGLASHLMVLTGRGAECCAYLVESADGSFYECILGSGHTVREAIKVFRESDFAARTAGTSFVATGLQTLMCNFDGVFAGLTVDGHKIYTPHERDETTAEYIDVAGMSFVDLLEPQEA